MRLARLALGSLFGAACATSSAPVVIAPTTSLGGAAGGVAPTTTVAPAGHARASVQVAGCSDVDLAPAVAAIADGWSEAAKLLGYPAGLDDATARARIGGDTLPFAVSDAPGDQLAIVAARAGGGLWVMREISGRIYEGFKCPNGLPGAEVRSERGVLSVVLSYERCTTTGSPADPAAASYRVEAASHAYAFWDLHDGARLGATSLEDDWTMTAGADGSVVLTRPECRAEFRLPYDTAAPG